MGIEQSGDNRPTDEYTFSVGVVTGGLLLQFST